MTHPGLLYLIWSPCSFHPIDWYWKQTLREKRNLCDSCLDMKGWGNILLMLGQQEFELHGFKTPLTCGFFSINAVALHHLQLFESKIGSHRTGGAVMGLHPQNLVYTASPGSSLPRVPRVYCYGWMCVYKNKHLSIYTHTLMHMHTHTHSSRTRTHTHCFRYCYFKKYFF